MEIREQTLEGTEGDLYVASWPHADPRYIALIVHGYGEHGGRYGHVAERLHADGAVVYAGDHLGHGRSDGDRALIGDGEHLPEDLGRVVELARSENPDLPMALIGHSMGGLVSTRFVQRNPDAVTALVLSGPIIGGAPAIEALLDLDPMPDIPIDPAVLSRDPAVGEAYLADDLVYHGPFQADTLRALSTAVQAVAAEPGFDSLPVLWLHGENDALAPYEVAAEAWAHLEGDRSESKVYPEAQHEIFNETNRDEVLDDVVAFINRSL